MAPFTISAQLNGNQNGVPYLETAMNRCSGVLKPPTPSAQNEIQSLSYVDADGNPVTPSAGTYDLVFDGQTTADISFDASASDIQSALESLSNIGAGNVSVTGTGPFVVEFVGALAGASQPVIIVANGSLEMFDNAISVTTTIPWSPSSSGTSSTVTLTMSSTAAVGNWTVGDWTGTYSSIPNPTGWTAIGTAADGSVSLMSSDGGAPEISWDGSGLIDGSGVGVTVSDNGSFVQGEPATPEVYQVDTIALDPDVNAGTWHVGPQAGIAYSDDGSGVQPAIEALLSISGGTIGNPSGGMWTYQYAASGDQASETASLAANIAGDTLGKPAAIAVAIIQAGG